MRFRSRSPVDEPPPQIHVHGQGTVGGWQVGRGEDPDSIGSFTTGRPATAPNVKAAARFWPEASIEDFEDAHDGWVDRASGQVYDVLGFDPLLSPGDVRDRASAFVVHPDGTIVFLKSRETTVDELERVEVERAQELARVEQERLRRLAKAKQVPIPLRLVYGEAMSLTLRGAAERIVQAGGTIGRGEHGELRVTVPERLTTDAITEGPAWAAVAVAAEILASARLVVLAAVDAVEADSSLSPRSLVERLPDAEVALGGGVVA